MLFHEVLPQLMAGEKIKRPKNGSYGISTLTLIMNDSAVMRFYPAFQHYHELKFDYRLDLDDLTADDWEVIL